MHWSGWYISDYFLAPLNFPQENFFFSISHYTPKEGWRIDHLKQCLTKTKNVKKRFDCLSLQKCEHIWFSLTWVFKKSLEHGLKLPGYLGFLTEWIGLVDNFVTIFQKFLNIPQGREGFLFFSLTHITLLMKTEELIG